MGRQARIDDDMAEESLILRLRIPFSLMAFVIAKLFLALQPAVLIGAGVELIGFIVILLTARTRTQFKTSSMPALLVKQYTYYLNVSLISIVNLTGARLVGFLLLYYGGWSILGWLGAVFYVATCIHFFREKEGDS